MGTATETLLKTDCTLVWLRLDLRLEDNPALLAGAKRGAVVPIYIWSPEEEEPWPPGGASRWWLHQSLASLDGDLRKLGSRLILRRGPAGKALADLVANTGATCVAWNDCYQPAVRKRDGELKKKLEADGVEVQTYSGSLLFAPASIAKGDGTPFQVFTAFWKMCLKQAEPEGPAARPRKLVAPKSWPKSLALAELALEPKIDWAAGIRSAWKPGEEGAKQALRRFVQGPLAQYATARNQPATEGTSRLSPYLHFGEVSPRRVWHSLKEAREGASTGDVDVYLREIGWREFAYHLLYHFPFTTNRPLRQEFGAFPWRHSRKDMKAWQKGQTGYPLVDAGMRQLWATGWMHNRVRLVVASFLTKHLRLPWEDGAYWFWDTLVDGDLANNTLNWQWSAGSGADAAPYFRIFNPMLQSAKFDPKAEYIRQWVPELSKLPNRWIHKPWEAPEDVLAEAGLELDRDYPRPVVEHEEARKAALAAFAKIRKHRS